MKSFALGDLVKCCSAAAGGYGVFGEVGQVVGVDAGAGAGDVFEVAVCGLRLWFCADGLEGVSDAESGADSGAVGGAGSAGGGDVGASADDGAGDVSGTCQECGRPYSADS